MGKETMSLNQKRSISLVIFTCQGREHLLKRCYESFFTVCHFKFDQIILAIDGPIDPEIINIISPDILIQHIQRKGYVNNILQALKVINTPYFFWLEDDWKFHMDLQLTRFLTDMQQHVDWAQIIYSKYGPLEEHFKQFPIGDNLYETTFGFSANPCICNTQLIQTAFTALEKGPKGDTLGEDGFENFLTRYFLQNHIKCVIHNPLDHALISHEGYLESTPRNWHMTNSLEKRTNSHLLTIPKPSFVRKTGLIFKLSLAFLRLSIGLMFSNKVYEFCFRIIASAKTIRNAE